MDKKSILKFFKDNADKAEMSSEQNAPYGISVQIMNHGSIIMNYGDNATTSVGATVNNNVNWTENIKQEVRDLINALKEKDTKGV